jgi:hypothetical protein
MSIIKTGAVLGVLGVIAVTSATPTLARNKHYPRAYRTDIAVPAYRVCGADPFMQERCADQLGFGYNAPRSTTRPMMSWDPYGLRWDGGGGTGR